MSWPGHLNPRPKDPTIVEWAVGTVGACAKHPDRGCPCPLARGRDADLYRDVLCEALTTKKVRSEKKCDKGHLFKAGPTLGFCSGVRGLFSEEPRFDRGENTAAELPLKKKLEESAALSGQQMCPWAPA